MEVYWRISYASVNFGVMVLKELRECLRCELEATRECGECWAGLPEIQRENKVVY